jgi:hypothetical protein
MYVLSFLFNGNQNVAKLEFKSEAAAVEEFNKFTKGLKQGDGGEGLYRFLKDDYGHKLVVTVREVQALLFANVERDLEATSEGQLLQAREQARLATRAQEDPLLKFTAAGTATTGPFRNVLNK